MQRLTKVVGILALLAILVLAGGVTWATVASWSAGSIRVQVEEHGPGGTHLAFVVPAVALDAALAIVPDRARAEIAIDAEAAAIVSSLDTICSDLEGRPDFVLVDVKGGRENVRIEKVGAVLRLAVESPDASVLVEIPLASMSRVARWIGGSGAPAVASL